MFYDKFSQKKIPTIYILTNNKFQKSYEIIFEKVKNIIKIENTEDIEWISICVDFEIALSNEINKIFKEVRIVGCLFHYIKDIRLNALKMGLFNKTINSTTENFIRELSAAPFNYENNFNILTDIFRKYENIYENKEYTNIY